MNLVNLTFLGEIRVKRIIYPINYMQIHYSAHVRLYWFRTEQTHLVERVPQAWTAAGTPARWLSREAEAPLPTCRCVYLDYSCIWPPIPAPLPPAYDSVRENSVR